MERGSWCHRFPTSHFHYIISLVSVMQFFLFTNTRAARDSSTANLELLQSRGKVEGEGTALRWYLFCCCFGWVWCCFFLLPPVLLLGERWEVSWLLAPCGRFSCFTVFKKKCKVAVEKLSSWNENRINISDPWAKETSSLHCPLHMKIWCSFQFCPMNDWI